MKVRLCCLITLSNDVRQGKNGIWTMWFSHEWSKKIGWWGMCFTWTRHEISWCVCMNLSLKYYTMRFFSLNTHKTITSYQKNLCDIISKLSLHPLIPDLRIQDSWFRILIKFTELYISLKSWCSFFTVIWFQSNHLVLLMVR